MKAGETPKGRKGSRQDKKERMGNSKQGPNSKNRKIVETNNCRHEYENCSVEKKKKRTARTPTQKRPPPPYSGVISQFVISFVSFWAYAGCFG